jgi:serine/threonine-protein kinase
VRSLDQIESQIIARTEGGFDPFFSPDGRWIGFFQGQQIKKVRVTGGEPLTICDMPSKEAAGASWAADDTIFFTPSGRSGLWRVPAAGGVPSPALSDNDVEYRWPHVLPSGKAVLFTSRDPGNSGGPDQIYVQSLETRQRHAVIQGSSSHVAAGHLIFGRGSTVLAVPFDLDTLRTSGTPLPLIDNVSIVSTVVNRPDVSTSRVGSLAFVPALGQPDGTLTWVDRAGTERPLAGPVRPYALPRIAPDGRFVAIAIEPTIGSSGDLWTYDLSRDVLTPVTSGGRNLFVAWTPDGHRLTFLSPRGISWTTADGSGVEEVLFSERPGPPLAWAPDGRTLAFVRTGQGNLADLWLLPFDDSGKPGTPRPLAQGPSREGGAVFSPDGRWVAYISNETGRNEVYVRSVDGSGRHPISTDGGNEVVWPRNGREIFYRNGDVMMAVDVTTSRTFVAGKSRALFRGQFAATPALFANYDVTPDGQRFLMIKPAKPSQGRPHVVNVVLNWPEGLNRLVPTQ